MFATLDVDMLYHVCNTVIKCLYQWLDLNTGINGLQLSQYLQMAESDTSKGRMMYCIHTMVIIFSVAGRLF